MAPNGASIAHVATLVSGLMSEGLGWGLIGTGGIAETFAADLMFTESGRAAAVGSRHIDTANRFADQFDIPNRHASYEALVADPNVDAVYISSPHPFHYDNAKLVLGAGKHALVEKPFTLNAREAREIVELAVERRGFPSKLAGGMGVGVGGEAIAIEKRHPPVHGRVG